MNWVIISTAYQGQGELRLYGLFPTEEHARRWADMELGGGCVALKLATVEQDQWEASQ